MGELLRPEDGLQPEDLMVDVISITYGMGDRNPIDCVRFYSKESPNTAVVIRRSEVSPLLPDKSVSTDGEGGGRQLVILFISCQSVLWLLSCMMCGVQVTDVCV